MENVQENIQWETVNGMYHVYLFSDATGETVERVLLAAMSQFRDVEIKLHRVSNLRTRGDVVAAVEEVVKHQGIIIYTLVNTEMAQLVNDESAVHGLTAVDLISPLLFKLSGYFGVTPREQPGLLYQMNSEYYKRVEAVDFTVKMDDGQDPRNLHKADIVFVGVSRTSKTPLSMYLAHKGYKVANVPLVNGIEPPRELFKIDQRRIVALCIDPRRLVELRSARLRNMGQPARSSYADFEKVVEELTYCKRLYRQHPDWLQIDVTHKAVEETAAEIIKKLQAD